MLQLTRSLPTLFICLSWFLCISKVNGAAVGIHFGSSTSSIASWRRSRGQFEIIPNIYEDSETPSIISFKDDAVFIGDDAKSLLTSNPENTVYDFKRIIGQKYTQQIQDYFKLFPFQVINGTDSKPVIQVNYQQKPQQYTATQLTSMILSNLVESAQSYLDRDIDEAVIAVPSYFTDIQRQKMKAAATDAGLKKVRFVKESIVAAMAYGLHHHHTSPGKYIIVYHFGDTTFDVSLYEYRGIFVELATFSDDELGGRYFNERVLEYMIQKFQDKHKIDIRDNERAKRLLMREIEKGKHILSFASQTRIEIENLVQGIDFSETLSRFRFEALNKDLFLKTIESIRKVLNDGDVDKREVNEFVLSGGSTLIPKIQELITEFFDGKKLNGDINPVQVIAHGAAAVAASGGYSDYKGERTPGQCDDDCMILNGHNIDIDINNNYASITYSFEFENIGRYQAELEYELNIDSGAYISHFIGEIDGVIYKGITKEKQKAAKEYQQAKKEKKNAILVSQNHEANTFMIQSNIESGSKAILNITVEQLLVKTFGEYELSLDISNIDNKFKTPSKMIPVTINFTSNNEVEHIEIPFGEYNVVEDEANFKRINAQITKQGSKGLAYFILRYKSDIKGGEENQMIFDAKSNTFLHRFGFGQEMKDKILPRRVVFVLDRSGSMNGIWSQAQDGMIGAISDLRSKFDRFGIVLFDTSIQTKSIKMANEKVIKDRINQIQQTNPGGATNLYGGIEAAMRMIIKDTKSNKIGPDGMDFVNQVVFVTDGMANVGVVKSDRILNGIEMMNSKFIKLSSSPISIFGIGIGDDYGNEWVENLNYPLIRQISIQNGGFDKRVKRSETKADLSKFYKILRSPQLTNIDIEYESEKYEINQLTQHKFNTLYAGTDIVICGKLVNKNNEKESDEQVTNTINAIITANGFNDKRKKEFKLSQNENDEMDIDRIWAYLSLKNYEKLLLQNEKTVEGVMRRLINENALNIALTYKLVTPWTSMIVVDDKNQTQKLEQEKEISQHATHEEYAYEIDDDDIHYEYGHYHDYDYEETSGILLLDVTPLSLGIEGRNADMIKMIEKNSVIPTIKQTQLNGYQLPQIVAEGTNVSSGVFVKVFQGERVKTSDNIHLGYYILNGKYDNDVIVNITFEIDANGILTVRSNDDINGKKEIIITADQGRPSQEEIDEMLRAAENFAEEDARMAETVQAKNALESAVYDLKNNLEDGGKLHGILSDDEKKILIAEANDTLDWLDDNPDADRDHYMEKQQEFDDVIKPILKEFYHKIYPHVAEEEDDGDDDYYSDHEDL